MFGNKILDFKDELLKDLNTLLSFESVDGEKNDECDNALHFILKRAEDFGLTGERTTDKSGHITLGDSGKLCGVLTHLDVVPAGNSWSVPPYALTEKDGRLYGRGIADDKGAALVTLYCLKAIKDSGVNGVNGYGGYGKLFQEKSTSRHGVHSRQRLRHLLCRKGYSSA